jgi:hypothetical protein
MIARLPMPSPAALRILLIMPVVACSTAPVPIAPPSPTAVSDLSLAEFPGAAGLLSGFDERRTDAKWDGGDEILFGLRLQRGDEVHHWLLHLSVVLGEALVARLDTRLEPPIALWEEKIWTYTATDRGEPHECQVRSQLLPVSVTVCDADGKKIGGSIVKLPVQLLGAGVLRAVDASLALKHAATAPPSEQPFRDDQARPMVEAALGMMALLSIVQQDDVLAQYFWQVVEKPSVWSVMTSLGVTASVAMPFEQSVPAEKLPSHLPPPGRAFVVPLRIDVNGSAALHADVIAVDPARPYALCGGMVGAVARHPTRSDLHFDVQLLAARVGNGLPRDDRRPR